jgi:hypothetical protein
MRWILSFLLMAAPAAAQRLAISEARAELPSFTLFLEASGAQGEAIVVGDPAALEATFGSHRLGVNGLASFDGARTGIAYIVLVDVSKSLGAYEFAEVRESLRVLASHLGPLDRMAVIRFADRPEVVTDFTADRNTLAAAFAGLQRTGDHTVLHLALRQALELGKRLDPQLPDRRAAIILTDGKDEGSGITIDDVLGDLRDNRLPFYTIGYSRLAPAERMRYFDLLKRLALDSGGQFFEAADSKSITRAYEDTRAAIARVLVAHLSCDGCVGDGRPERLQVTLRSGDRVFTDAIDLRVAPAAEAAQPADSATPAAQPKPAIPAWAYAAAGTLVTVALVVVVVALLNRSRSKQAAAAANVDAPATRATKAEPVPVPDPLVPLEFVVVRGQCPGTSYRLSLAKRATIGTAADSDLRLTSEPAVAAHQFELECVLGKIVIRNLAAGQTTSVNGIPIRSQYLISHGDLISAGNTDLRVVVGS